MLLAAVPLIIIRLFIPTDCLQRSEHFERAGWGRLAEGDEDKVVEEQESGGDIGRLRTSQASP